MSRIPEKRGQIPGNGVDRMGLWRGLDSCNKNCAVFVTVAIEILP